MNPSERKSRIARNKSRRKRAEFQFLLRWPQKKPSLLPLKAQRYSGNARLYRIRKEYREGVSENFPRLLCDAILSSLIDYRAAQKGEETHDEETKLVLDPGLFSTDPVKLKSAIDLGVLLLRRLLGVPKYARKDGKGLFAPLLALLHTLEDLREGVKSKYTEPLLRSKRGGHPKPSPVIVHHRQTIGTAYRLLRKVGLYSKKRALRRLKLQMKQLGLPHNHSDLSEFADQSSNRQFHLLRVSFAEQLLKVLGEEIPGFRSDNQWWFDLVNSATSEEFDRLWPLTVKCFTSAINDGALVFTSLERYKILRTWVFLLDSFVLNAFYFFGELTNIRRFPGYSQRK